MARTTARAARSEPATAGAVHSLDEFGLEVPDLEPARAFYEAFGLDVRREGESLGLYAHGQQHRWAVITRGPRKRLRFISFAAFAPDYEQIASRVAARGLGRIGAPSGATPEGLWFSDPDTLSVRVRVAPRRTPDHKIAPLPATAPAGSRAAISNLGRPAVHPLRFSHIACFCTDVPRSVRFYCDVLGLQVADHVGEVVAFMRGVHGSDHHILALARSSGPGMHHCSWEVGSIDNVGLAGRQLEDRGYPYQANWGPGRHVIGSNYFYYVRDPWGSYAELTADMDYIEAGMPWNDHAYGMEDAMYLWGPPPPEHFLSNRELEPTR